MVSAALLDAVPVFADPTAAQWLERMSEAAHTLDYRGTLVFQEGERMETVEIVHRMAGGDEQERISARSGAAREVVRDGNRVTCIQPEKNTVVETPGLPLQGLLGKEAGHGVERLAGSYVLKLEGDERIAGRPARKLKIIPRDHFRYGYRLWLDEESALPLKSQLIGAGEQVLEQVMFTKLEHGVPISAEAVAPTLSGERHSWEHQAPSGDESAEAGRWQVTLLPPGFELSLESGHTLPDHPTPVRHLLFSDGLASVSVFIEKEGEGAARAKGRGSHGVGAVHAFIDRRDGHRITVVGEVPATTVKMIGESVRRREAP